MIRLRNVEKCFKVGKGSTYVLRWIDLCIKRGEFVTIMGPSGAGKSTLLSILGMFDAAFDGDYHFMNQPVRQLRPAARQKLNREHIGFVFQQFHLLEDLTVYENLDVPLSYRNFKSKERASLVGDMLDRFQMVGKKDLFPSQLSGGQQQLVGVARAIIAKPDLILADEPTGNLHSKQAREIMEVFKQLHEDGATIIQVTHSAENAAFSDRIIRLPDGRIEGDSAQSPAASA